MSSPYDCGPTAPDYDRVRQVMRERFALREQDKKATPKPAPRYDEVFVRGTKWLDTL